MMKDNGEVIETPGAHESRASLSIVKLYLGHWVLQHGAPEDKALVYEMIRSSHDGIASNLDRKYRQAIPDTIGRFRLTETNYRGRWGDTTTSVHDMAAFVRAVRTDPAARPLMTACGTLPPLPPMAIPRILVPPPCPVSRAPSLGGRISAMCTPP